MRAPIAARLGLALVAMAACAKAPAAAVDARRPAGGAALRATGLHGLADPTVHGARLVPASLDEASVWGSEPGGGVRGIVAGLRIVSSPAGDVAAARDRLPGNPSTVTELPERLGGGFLMALGPHLWSAQTWLGPAAPIFSMPSAITEVLVGLDRAYVRSGQGPLLALDARTGALLDLGPLPASPRVASIAALDAWRALAVADLRGAVLTLDAGSSWRPVPLPIEPLRAAPLDEAFSVAGFDRARAPQWWSVLPDGQASWFASSPSPARTVRAGGHPDAAAPLGARPLAAAVEDGWPLSDGTALVARDGALARVRVADGSLVEMQPDAFPLKPARCHPLSLARAADPGAFGFVCGEPRGTTLVLRWDAQPSRLIELRRFDAPREVLASGGGALAVRGRCAPQDANGSQADNLARDHQDWCLMGPDGDWSEMHFSGQGVGGARLVVLSSRRVALVRPPEGGDLSTARLTLTDGLTDGARATHLPLRVEPLPPEIARALRWGIWMDGFEERRPGVLGGWIDAAGSILGVEITLDGELRAGEYIRDAGAPVAAGRWAFGWTASRGGFETTDGGMSWSKEIALPEPIAEPRAERRRHCGPIGCVIAGWLRVGWGPAEEALPATPPPPRSRVSRRAPGLVLDCVSLGGAPPADGEGNSPPPPPDSVAARLRLQTHSPARGFGVASSWGAVSQLRPFGGLPGPPIATGELGLSIDASHPLERGLRPRPLARGYAWGPSAGDWHPSGGHWQVRWLWPWQGASPTAPEERSSAIGLAPWASLELAARAFASPMGTLPEWTLVPGDDADHALLIERRAGLAATVSASPGTVAIEALEADRAPVEVRRADGETLPELQGAVRSDGRWYLATAQEPGEPSATVVWVIDGAVGRELGRLPRVAPDTAAPGRLVRWSGGGNGGGAPSPLALVVAGVDAERGAVLWVTTFDPETRTFGDPEPLAPADLSDRTVAPCTGDDAGWELETSYPGTVDVRVGQAWASRLQGVLARLRLSRTAACVDGLFATADSKAAHEDGALATSRPTAPPAEGARLVDATVLGERTRARLRCQMATR